MWLKIFAVFATLFACFRLTLGYDLTLRPAKETYKILLLHPLTGPSHQIPFVAVAKALADRGHQITFMSSLPSSLKHDNITEINHIVSHYMKGIPSFERHKKDPTGAILFKNNLPQIAKEIFDDPAIMELYHRRHDFDLIITDDLFLEPGYPFLVDKRYAVISPIGITPQCSSKLGNVLNPSYQPSISSDYPRPYSFLERTRNLWEHFISAFLWKYWYVAPAVEVELRKKFPTLPSASEIEKGMGLVLANVHFSLDIATPLLPSQVQVGGLHCRPGEQLPQDLKDFIEGSGSNGTIYFSLGSVVQEKTMPLEYKNIIIRALSQLQQRVIWKFDADIQDLPKNIMVRKWLPQQDILAHSNIKLFISHGGSLSVQETIYHSKPILILPVMGDQMKNGQRAHNMGFGEFLHWEQLSVDLLVSTINKIIVNNKYNKVAEKMSANFKDQQLSPLDNAIWWIEYFIRNNGAPQLQSPAVELSWIEYLMIDILIVVYLILFCLFWIIKKIIFVILGSFTKSNNYKTKNKDD